jgi:hypothetical protein
MTQVITIAAIRPEQTRKVDSTKPAAGSPEVKPKAVKKEKSDTFAFADVSLKDNKFAKAESKAKSPSGSLTFGENNRELYAAWDSMTAKADTAKKPVKKAEAAKAQTKTKKPAKKTTQFPDAQVVAKAKIEKKADSEARKPAEAKPVAGEQKVAKASKKDIPLPEFKNNYVTIGRRDNGAIYYNMSRKVATGIANKLISTGNQNLKTQGEAMLKAMKDRPDMQQFQFEMPGIGFNQMDMLTSKLGGSVTETPAKPEAETAKKPEAKSAEKPSELGIGKRDEDGNITMTIAQAKNLITNLREIGEKSEAKKVQNLLDRYNKMGGTKETITISRKESGVSNKEFRKATKSYNQFLAKEEMKDRIARGIKVPTRQEIAVPARKPRPAAAPQQMLADRRIAA